MLWGVLGRVRGFCVRTERREMQQWVFLGFPVAPPAEPPLLSSRLLSAVLRTSEVESRATRASLTQLLSPQMGKDIMWFLRRWAKTYLLVDEKLYGQVRGAPLHPAPGKVLTETRWP